MSSIKRLSSTDQHYPKRLLELSDPPKQLFHIGDVARNLDGPTLAVVGSRKVTPYGRQVTEKLVKAAAAQGITIISGLALGVDGIAHQAALDAKGKTLAVLAGGLDAIHPSSHRQLAVRIIQANGALASEYSTGSRPFKTNFIARNRIVAALADAILITEATSKSGTLHTVNFGLELGKTVMAVPGNITSEQSGGTNNLIKTGAVPVTDIRDILSAMGLESGQQQTAAPFGDNAEESRILQLLFEGTSDAAELLAVSEFDPRVFNQHLTMLEINGKVRPLGAGHWGLV